MKKVSRRNFLASTALTAGVAFAAPSFVLGKSNEEVRLGFIGLGGRGSFLTKFVGGIPKARITALCDVDSKRLDACLKRFPDAKGYTDLRKLIEDDNVDAVVIATCNHWHCLAAVWAMQAGKHVYVEKPLCLSFWEGRQVVNASIKYKKVCQIGTQMRTDPVFHPEVKKFLHEEKALGKIESVRINRFAARPSIGKRVSPLEVPSEVDYNLWLGPAQDRPIYREKFHYDWHWMWYTGNGETGNWGAHLIDDCRNDILCDKVQMPKRVLTGGGRVGYNDVGDTPNSMFIYFDTGIIPVIFCISNLPDAKNRRSTGSCPGPESGYVAYCEGGRYEKYWGGSVAYDKDGKVIRNFKGTTLEDGSGKHLSNFVDAVLANDIAVAHAPISIGYDSSAWYNGANMAYRLGHPYSKKEALGYDDTPNGTLARAIDDLEKHLTAQNIPMNADTFKLSRFLEIDQKNECFAGEYAHDANALMEIHYRTPFAVPEVRL